MASLFLIGRIIVGGFYLYGAYHHFTAVSLMAGYAASKGVPAPQAAIILTGLLLLIGGLSVLSGVAPRLGVLAIVCFLLPVSIIMHNFWAIADPMQKAMQTVNFTKNMALLGSALMFLAVRTPWPLSLGK